MKKSNINHKSEQSIKSTKQMKRVNKNQSIRALNPILGFGWKTGKRSDSKVNEHNDYSPNLKTN